MLEVVGSTAPPLPCGRWLLASFPQRRKVLISLILSFVSIGAELPRLPSGRKDFQCYHSGTLSTPTQIRDFEIRKLYYSR
ncbi:hypothetical protein E2C01_013949 [Portunus trituberculatus]|uniref:Uncharacterized protein n=1 Tax=Portunus trituberculatus TaxID=210409 RepID=A0A5B7DIU5_PORTR|nr:hypothetical protein [Portunus trituberculatus]